MKPVGKTRGTTTNYQISSNMFYTGDTVPPVIHGCPEDILSHCEVGESMISVSWEIPSASDDRGRVILLYSSHVPGQGFPVGLTNVTYIYADDSYNIAYCNFSIAVEESKLKLFFYF